MGDFDIDKIDLWSSILRNYMYFYIFFSPIFFKSCIQIELSFIFCKLNDDIILKTYFINLSVFKIAMLNHNKSTYFYIEKIKVFFTNSPCPSPRHYDTGSCRWVQFYV